VVVDKSIVGLVDEVDSDRVEGGRRGHDEAIRKGKVPENEGVEPTKVRDQLSCVRVVRVLSQSLCLPKFFDLVPCQEEPPVTCGFELGFFEELLSI
jgi:hypothetical protein